jgi:plasmid stabilization system protein ParE
VPRLAWSLEAVRNLATLPLPVRDEILSKTRLLADFPEMYPVRRRGRFRGQRFFASFDWIVYYVVRRDGPAITTIGRGRRNGA